MAFEDRSSPSTATSPNSDLSKNTINSPNSPESSRTAPYTCRTIPAMEDKPHYHQQIADRSSFFRITAFALSNQQHGNDRSATTSPRSPTSPADDCLRSYSQSESSRSTPQHELIVDEDVPRIQTLKYSIRNILQPDFGKNAVRRTRVTPKITFKPYEEVSTTLGSLCQTVSQIGQQRKQEQSNRINANDECRSTSPSADSVKSVLPNPDALKTEDGDGVPKLWPAWVYCTRYSDRPSSGPRSKRAKKTPSAKPSDDKRPRTAFNGAQLARLKHEFVENRYLTERRRQHLSAELGLNEAQIKIWFQNKRAKIKKASGQKNPLALQLMAQGLYNHSTVTDDEADMPMPEPRIMAEQNGV